MSNAIAIQPIDLYGVASIRQVLFQSLLAATSANDVSPLDSTSSIVQLSASGQVIGAGATLQSSLEALQANTANATPSTVQATAQAFVAAFNHTQQSLAAALPLVWSWPDNSLVTQLARTLNASGTSSTTSGTLNLNDLQAIGISFITSASTTTDETTARLTIDQNVLNAAAAANPAATATLLAEATQSLLQQVTTFEVQATNLTQGPTDTAVQGSEIPTARLQNLSADTVLNHIQLKNLDLAAVGLSASTIQPTGSALDQSLAATTALADTSLATQLTAVTDATPVAVHAMPSAAVTLATPELASTAPNVLGAVTATTTATNTNTNNPSPPQVAAVATVDRLSVDQAAADATHALQVMMADSALHDVIFNPAYSAFMASSHMSDFIEHIARTRLLPAEIPGAVLPINRINAFSSYQDAASAFVGR